MSPPRPDAGEILTNGFRSILPGYEPRPGQAAMASAVARALESERHLFVEAGTGPGQTFAYLVPAILSGRKVVVSTATRALQDQIYEKDLPVVMEVLAAHGVEVDAALMKGLPNYVCKRRLREAVAAGADPVLLRIAAWEDETTTGDRAELSTIPEGAAAWSSVLSSADTRIGAGCPHHETCFVTAMKRAAERARILVVNHHLFFADLALRAGPRGDFASAIPAYDAVVFDEAHQLENVATEFFGHRVSLGNVSALVEDAARALRAAKLVPPRGGAGSATRLLDNVQRAGDAFFGSLRRSPPSRARPPDSRDKERRLLADIRWTTEDTAAYHALDSALEALEAFAELEGVTVEAVRVLGRRAGDLRRRLAGILDGEKGRVAWLDVEDRGVALGASTVDLAPTLAGALFERVSSVVCTSATLSVAGHFRFIRARLGAREAEELVVPSPFDFQSNAGFYVASDLPEPAAPGFDDLAGQRTLELVEISGGGAFVLTTSLRTMRLFHERLRARWGSRVLVQGDAPKQSLLARFRSVTDAVLVATSSFWEGIDVPGDALRLVVLDKIPFAVPTDPVTMARSREIEDGGGNAFAEYAIPQAAISLKQGFGRLVRSASDRGVVALLDARITRRGYGKALLASLPPARRLGTLDEVRGFFSSPAAGGGRWTQTSRS